MENKRKISAKIVADSIDPRGNRITTFVLTYPRFIHAELMTHRLFSRNSASSRAIPFEKMVKMVEEDPFIPIAWQKDHKGMQGTEYWVDNDTVTVDEGDEYERYTKIYSATEHFITEWLEARDLAIAQSYELNRLGVTKQLCNRLLEPFQWYTCLVTATEFDNFYELRCPKYKMVNPGTDFVQYFKSKKDWVYAHDVLMNTRPKQSEESILKEKELISKLIPDGKYNELEWIKLSESGAEIHIQALAEAMWDAQNESVPKELKAGEWHIPFGDNISINKLDNYYRIHIKKVRETFAKLIYDRDLYKIKISTARCARLSYMTFDGEIDYEKDIQLHDRLLADGHASPFEHISRCLTEEEYNTLGKMILDPVKGYIFEKGWVDNFKGFVSYRRILNF